MIDRRETLHGSPQRIVAEPGEALANRTSLCTARSRPGTTPTPSTACPMCVTPSIAARPSSATRITPRLAASGNRAAPRRSPAGRRNIDARPQTASQHRLAPRRRAPDRKRIRLRLDAPPHGWAARSRDFRAHPVNARARVLRSQEIGYGPLM